MRLSEKSVATNRTLKVGTPHRWEQYVTDPELEENPPMMQATYQEVYDAFAKRIDCTPVPEAVKAAAASDHFPGKARILNSTNVQPKPRLHKMKTRPVAVTEEVSWNAIFQSRESGKIYTSRPTSPCIGTTRRLLLNPNTTWT